MHILTCAHTFMCKMMHTICTIYIKTCSCIARKCSRIAKASPCKCCCPCTCRNTCTCPNTFHEHLYRHAHAHDSWCVYVQGWRRHSARRHALQCQPAQVLCLAQSMGTSRLCTPYMHCTHMYMCSACLFVSKDACTLYAFVGSTACMLHESCMHVRFRITDYWDWAMNCCRCMFICKPTGRSVHICTSMYEGMSIHMLAGSLHGCCMHVCSVHVVHSFTMPAEY